MVPNQYLCEVYGTKVADVPVKALVGLLGAGLLIADQAHSRKRREELKLMDEMSRAQEAQRMLPVRQGLRGGGGIAPDVTDYQSAGSFAPYDPSLPMALQFEKGGAAELAHELFKTADFRNLAKATGAGVRGLGGLLSHRAGEAVQLAGQGAQGVGKRLQQGFGATGRLMQAAGPEFMEGLPKTPAVRLGGSLERAGSAVAQRGAATQEAAKGVVGGAKDVAKRELQQHAAQATKAKKDAEPFIGPWTKAKVLGTAGMLGAGYAGMKTMGAMRDYMETPSEHKHQQYIRSDTSPYGY